MREKNSHAAVESSAVCYDTLEQWARGQIQDPLQRILEEEVTTFLGRPRHARRERVSPVDPPKGSRNGYGKPRQFAMTCGTVTVWRPRVRDLEERFKSKVLPLFTRRTREIGRFCRSCICMGSPAGTSNSR